MELKFASDKVEAFNLRKRANWRDHYNASTGEKQTTSQGFTVKKQAMFVWGLGCISGSQFHQPTWTS